jgi:hypothetical protein
MDGSRDRLHDAPQPRNFFGDPLLFPAVFERTELLHHDPGIDLDGAGICSQELSPLKV